MKQVIVITGASSGFGALAARALAQAGHIVYATMRETTGRNAPQVAEAEHYAAEHGVDLRTVELDVASAESVEAGIAKIIADTGRLDVVIHNAGHMSFGPAEAFTPEQFAELFDVNVLSTQRVNRAALPQLRKQGRGLVIWVSSSSARGGTPPYLSPYFAAKAAMDSLAVSHAELPFAPTAMESTSRRERRATRRGRPRSTGIDAPQRPRAAYATNGRLSWPHVAVELTPDRQFVRCKTRRVLSQQIALRAPQDSSVVLPHLRLKRAVRWGRQ